MRTRIKFCGITRTPDAVAAVELGVDAVGVVFTRMSQRFVGITQARAIRRALPPLVTLAALFMDDESSWIEEVIASVQPDLLQFHGAESAGFAASFARPYIKAVPMASAGDIMRFVSTHPAAAGFLFDSHAPGTTGGRGEVFDWARLPDRIGRTVILAGGLDAQNVAQAIAAVRPFAVDVSSGIETAPGIKDATRMRAFVAAVHAAHQT